MTGLDGKVAIVTGGGSGLGEAIVLFGTARTSKRAHPVTKSPCVGRDRNEGELQ
jgi:NADP-dependent 3-hydroxy acid dehydrogenase YdfG